MQDQLQTRNAKSKMPPKGWLAARRRTAYQAPPKSRFRRILGMVFNRWTLSAVVLILFAGILTFTYFWFLYSDEIDRRLLSGEVFTPSAGIYTAPKNIKTGDQTNAAGLVDYLKSAGYIEASVSP